jgi:hypothetical protein
MKRILSAISILLLATLLIAVQAQAKDNAIYINNAYWKGDGFDIVVKQTPNLKMKLYVDDKNPTSATVNSEGWATFSRVKLVGNGKISFAWVNDSNQEHPIDYTSKFNVPEPKVSFAEDNPAPAPAAAVPVSTPPPAAQPKAEPVQPASAAQPSVYYKNCTAARSAGVTPLHRSDPGYASHLDRDNDGIACE